MNIRFSVVFWWLVLVLSGLALVFLAVAGLVVDESNTSSISNALRSMTSASWLSPIIHEVGELASNGVISGLLFIPLSAGITLSLIHIFKIPAIRRISIQLLAAGYYENFLHGVIDEVYRRAGRTQNNVIIILPGFTIVKDKSRYWSTFLSIAERHEFRFVQQTTDSDFGRNVFTIQRKDNSPVPIFIDMPTTLTNLKTLIELEESSPVGKVLSQKRIEKRFYFLRDVFEKELRTYAKEGDWGNIRFVEGRSVRELEKELGDIMKEIEGS